MKRFRFSDASAPPSAIPGGTSSNDPDFSWPGMATLAQRLGGFAQTSGNAVTLYHEGVEAFEAILEAIHAARHHVHLEYFIIQVDESGHRLLDLLIDKARQGVEVRLLYDAMGTRHIQGKLLRRLLEAGIKCSVFLPLNPLRRRIQVNMRNHRKIVVVDGQTAFVGGLNVGDEYLGRDPRYGYWRDTHLQLRGPAVYSLQRVFVEDWDFAANEELRGGRYFPRVETAGEAVVQVMAAGPDQELNGIREVFFAALQRARRRIWIATPYFVPDAGLRDALCLAGYLGVDVRLLCQHEPDKWVPYFAARYHWADVLGAGVKVYQYSHGMLHSKVVLVDGEWASVGTANFDNRSLHLNFEVTCLIYTPELIRELESAFLRDLGASIRLTPRVYEERPLAGRVVENTCRLLSPLL